jgi:histidinol-phosphatase (PHP family)
VIKALAEDPRVDFFIGSVHHVHGVPIDYDRTMYEQARDETDQKLFEDYFDAMFAMLKDLRPPVVGHFDLIRLFSDAPNQDLKTWDGVWTKVVRNLNLIIEQGGLLEINSSALRKGLREPYPSRSVCEV